MDERQLNMFKGAYIYFIEGIDLYERAYLDEQISEKEMEGYLGELTDWYRDAVNKIAGKQYDKVEKFF